MRNETRIRPESSDPGSIPCSEVPHGYDGLNRLLTLGLDQRWRRQAARACLASHPARVLDLCCGTGDLALQLLELDTGTIDLVGVDLCASRLEAARRKARASGVSDRLSLVQADASRLPFAAGFFDSLGIAFAFRDLTYKNPLGEACLAEMRRVLAPAGRLVIVETSQPRVRLLRSCMHGYLRAIVGPVGGFIARKPVPYRSLARSARRYFRPEEVARLLRRAGFEEVKWTPLLGGIASLHIAIR